MAINYKAEYLLVNVLFFILFYQVSMWFSDVQVGEKV